ncbi:hypothetical protein [Pontibacter lucknowensis]|uniref:SpoIIAA-like n=1 Tax=Pontibacter lucknowensis TaxID=1077936 RepID=A0A1N6W661_9BACT|nr:hypothetical protein [Pontibacter lucknowensis]SIQ85518.1 hypothetical protein SAMN05421545_1378 [Pontibacter lucknowensis]
MNLLNFEKALEQDFVTIRHSPENKMLWNQWRGSIPSDPLREAMIFACEFIVANEIELILADYTKMQPPSLQDQNWIAIHSAEILQHSKLKRVANVMGTDIFQQLSIETIYQIASQTPLPCESRDFMFKDDALEWLFSTE